VGKKAVIGITRDLFDTTGKLILPGFSPKQIKEEAGIDWSALPEFSREVAPNQIEGFDFVISSSLPQWNSSTFTDNHQLLSIHRTGIGYNMVDVPSATRAGVLLCITPKAVRRPVAMAILTFLFSLSTRLLNKDRLTREGHWQQRAKYHGIGLTGKTLGTIGVGNIGHEMFMLAKPFGMKHISYDPYAKQDSVSDVDVELVDIDIVLTQSDFLIVCCPLNQETHHLIGEEEMLKMKNSAFLINVARGPIVEEVALIKALKKGWLQGAGIDVFEQEPTPPDNPLLYMDNVIVTPHSLCWTDEFFMVMWEQIFNQISQIIEGKIPSGIVNHEVWDNPGFQAKLKKFHKVIK
jgi:phosphoglycerate dehydrogenase-like enzyme